MENAQPDGRFRAALDVTLDLPLASVGSRALAQGVDGAIVTLLTTLLLGVCVGLAIALEVADVPYGWGWAGAVFVLATFALQSGYFLAFEHLWQGQTPGKRLLGLRVVTDEGATPDFTALAVRNLVRTVDGLLGIGVVAIVASTRAKRLGDLAAGTVVVFEEPHREAAARRWPAGLSPAEVRTLESWFAGARDLPPDRREALAARLLAALRARHPELRPSANHAAAEALALLFPA